MVCMPTAMPYNIICVGEWALLPDCTSTSYNIPFNKSIYDYLSVAVAMCVAVLTLRLNSVLSVVVSVSLRTIQCFILCYILHTVLVYVVTLVYL